MKTSWTRSLRHAALALAVLCSMAGAWPAAAQVDPNDADEDGVADATDQCLDTPPLDMVDPDGCSVCPCDAPVDADAWTSHDAYLSCVSDEAKARRRGHTMTRRQMRGVLRSARKSSCGNAALTRCCVYQHLDDNADVNIGQCRIMTPDACDGLTDQVDWAEDIDTGSCTPNPCEF